MYVSNEIIFLYIYIYIYETICIYIGPSRVHGHPACSFCAHTNGKHNENDAHGPNTKNSGAELLVFALSLPSLQIRCKNNCFGAPMV